MQKQQPLKDAAPPARSNILQASVRQERRYPFGAHWSKSELSALWVFTFLNREDG